MKINNKIKEIEKKIEKIENEGTKDKEGYFIEKFYIEIKTELKLLKQFQKEIKEFQEEARRKSIVVGIFDDKEKTHNKMCVKVKDINEIIKKRFGEKP